MLKITKGLKPFIEEDISTYMDDDGNQYVRVKLDGEDFCIAAHDYTRDGKQKFTWNEAMKIVKEIGMSLPTKKQVELYRAHYNEINDKLKEIGDELSADAPLLVVLRVQQYLRLVLLRLQRQAQLRLQEQRLSCEACPHSVVLKNITTH